MFVNQAPLYYDLKHGLPPMYNELALLIQQLSLLSSHYDAGKDLPDFDLDMLPRTKVCLFHYRKFSNQPPDVVLCYAALCCVMVLCYFILSYVINAILYYVMSFHVI